MSEPPPLPQQKSGGCERTLTFALVGAASLGFIGFAAGFVGPIIFRPEANQGPLLGNFYYRPSRLRSWWIDWGGRGTILSKAE